MISPFSDLSLLETSSRTASPGLLAAIGICGRIAADLGVAVTRTSSIQAHEPGSVFLSYGKRILRLPDIDSSKVETELKQTDVLVSDAALKLNEDAKPRLVHVIVSMGAVGTDDKGQSEFTIEAQAGLLEMVGDPDRAPLRLGGHKTAYAAGIAAFTGLVSALCQTPLAEGPREVRVSLLETAVWLNWKGLAMARDSGNPPTRAGTNGEWPVLSCKDGYVVVVHRPQEWKQLLNIVQDPAISEDRFQTAAGRRKHRSDLNAILAKHFALLTRADIHALSLRSKLPFGAVSEPNDLKRDPQMTARAVLKDISVNGVSLQVPRLPVIWHEAVS